MAKPLLSTVTQPHDLLNSVTGDCSMTPSILLIFAIAFFTYSLVAEQLDSTPITGPMLFLGLGILLSPNGLSLVELSINNAGLHLLVELTLVLVLFADAATVPLKALSHDKALPTRMLALGLPLTVALGTGIAIFLFPELNLWEAALLAAILTPTDAALGLAVVNNPAVPERFKRSIVVESGLNDGMMLPLVLLFATFASMGSGHDKSAADWATFLVLQLGVGPLAGIIVGWLGAQLILKADSMGWMGDSGQGIASLALALAAYTFAETLHGNGFVAAFAGGLAFGSVLKDRCKFLLEFQEVEAKILVLMAFLVVGLVLVPTGLPTVNSGCVVFAVLSLTVQRMLPVSLSLAGSGINTSAKLFLGWFGPRGLASVLFLLLVLEEFDPAGGQRILTVVMTTVVLSVVLHGISAAPLARWMGPKLK